MTLQNLLKNGQLKSHATDPTEIRRLVDAARRNLVDSRVREISPETRFDAAYKAIMQAALVGLMANGFRPDTQSAGPPYDGLAVPAHDHRPAQRSRGRS